MLASWALCDWVQHTMSDAAKRVLLTRRSIADISTFHCLLYIKIILRVQITAKWLGWTSQ